MYRGQERSQTGLREWQSSAAEPLFTKRTGVLPQDLVKSRSRAIGCYNDRIALKFDRHLDAVHADVPVKFQSRYNYENLNFNLAASSFHETLHIYYRRPSALWIDTQKVYLVEVWERINNFAPDFIIDVITYPCWD